MKFSKYNYLALSKQYGGLLYNTRTKFFISLTRDLFDQLTKLSLHKDNNITIESLNLTDDLTNALIRGKVFVGENEDDDFFNLKKFLRYNQAFTKEELSIVLAPTLACNFQCPYCYENNLPLNIITESTIDSIISFIKNKGHKSIDLCWHGGEPLLAFKQICTFLNKAKENGIKIKSHEMITNGFLLDEDKCKILSQYDLNKVQITIDGDKNWHNKSRVHKSELPTYDTIINGIENVFKYMPNCHVLIRVNIHSENQESFPQLYYSLKDKWEGKNYSIRIEFANNVNNSCKVACIAETHKINYARSLYEKYGIDVEAIAQPQIGGCAASCINTLVIGPMGEIYKCWVDVGKKDRIIGDVFGNHTNNNILSSYLVGSDMFSDSKCKNCTFMPLCDGGCIVRRYNQKHHNIPYNPCPINEKDFLSWMELQYMKITSK